MLRIAAGGREPWIVLIALFLAASLPVGCGGAETLTVTQTATETTTDTVTETVAATDAERAELDRLAAQLEERAAAVQERERKVKRQEDVIARSRFGDGTFLVGKDVPPGSYLAPGSPDGDCYWARLRPGGDIIDNHIGAGQVRATLVRGELFESSGCGTWRRG